MSASFYDDLTKSTTGLLQDSFPIDPKKKTPRSITTFKAATKSPAGTRLSAQHDKQKDSTESKFELGTDFPEWRVSVKDTVTIKGTTKGAEATLAIGVSAVDYGAKGTKFGVEGKLTQGGDNAGIQLNPSFDFSNASVATRIKSELKLGGESRVDVGKTEFSVVGRAKDAYQGGFSVKGDSLAEIAGLDVTAGVTATYSPDANTSIAFGYGKTLDKKKDQPTTSYQAVTVSGYRQWCGDCKGRIAFAAEIPTVGKNISESSLKTALLWNANADTTLGVFAGWGVPSLALGGSVRVKINNHLTGAFSVHTPTASDTEPIVGFGLEFSD